MTEDRRNPKSNLLLDFQSFKHTSGKIADMPIEIISLLLVKRIFLPVLYDFKTSCKSDLDKIFELVNHISEFSKIDLLLGLPLCLSKISVIAMLGDEFFGKLQKRQ